MRHKMQSTQVQPQNNIFTNGNLKIDYDTNCVYLADMLEQSDDGEMQYEDRQKEQINTSLNAVWQLYEYLK